MARLPLVAYVIRVVPPRDNMTDEEMDEALRVWEATAGHNDNLWHLIHERFVKGVDSLGAAGFTVEVEEKR